MFNMLNEWISEGKKSPMVCKILSRMSTFAHSLYFPLPAFSYLLEGRDFRNWEIL
jgi:hypothetical protein